MPDWPPVDYDYGPALEEKNLRVVEKISWKIEDEILDGKRKVYKIPGYPGYYKNSDVLYCFPHLFLRINLLICAQKRVSRVTML